MGVGHYPKSGSHFNQARQKVWKGRALHENGAYFVANLTFVKPPVEAGFFYSAGARGLAVRVHFARWLRPVGGGAK